MLFSWGCDKGVPHARQIASHIIRRRSRRRCRLGRGSPRCRCRHISAPADLNTHADDYGYHPGRRSFYSYPRHRHIEGGGDDDGTFDRPVYGSDDRSPNYDGSHGSPYYGTNYGAPYFGGGYYDGGVYYRERRD